MNMQVLDQEYFIAHPGQLFQIGEEEKRPFSVSFLTALALHILLLFFGGLVLVDPPEYGIDLGRGGMEIYLVAAPAEIMKEEARPKLSVKDEPQEMRENPNAEMALPVFQKTGKTEEIKAPEKKLQSTPSAGTDPTTFYSSGGAWTANQPGHLKNPAPYYPQSAIEQQQEGLVVLSVFVLRDGRPAQVEIKQSSGFPLLDKSALTTIKKWKFSPAQTGFLARDARVTIPIRFQLVEES